MAKPKAMNKSLPSSDAAAEFLAGADGGTGKLIASTLLRSILIAPGLIIAGVDGRKAVLGAVASSVMISAFILAYLKYGQPKPNASAIEMMGPYRRPLATKRHAISRGRLRTA